MRFFRSLTRETSVVSAVLLVMAVLFSQWAGLQHGINHSGVPFSKVAIAHVDATDGDVQHSCIAFDAAALADSISLAPYLAPLLTSARVLSLWSAFVSWDAPFTSHFSSRAPPLP